MAQEEEDPQELLQLDADAEAETIRPPFNNRQELRLVGGCFLNLAQCARYGELEDLQMMLKIGVDVNTRDPTGRTALFFAAANGHVDITKVLLEQDADFTIANEEGNTAMHWACLNGHAEVVRALMDAGAAATTLNSAQMTPYDEALSRNHAATIEVLAQFMGKPENADIEDPEEGDEEVEDTDGEVSEALESEMTAEVSGKQ